MLIDFAAFFENTDLHFPMVLEKDYAFLFWGKAQINEIQPSASMNPEEEKAKTIQGKSYEKPSQGTMRI